jgi:hypothetical protein
MIEEEDMPIFGQTPTALFIAAAAVGEPTFFFMPWAERARRQGIQGWKVRMAESCTRRQRPIMMSPSLEALFTLRSTPWDIFFWAGGKGDKP